MGVVFILFDLLFSYFSNGTKLVDSVQIGIETIIILGFSFYYLYEKTNDTTTLYIYSTFQFWVVIGMALYLSGSFFIFLFADTLSQKQAQGYWYITNIFSILKSLFFTIAIIVNSKPSKQIPMSEFDFGSLN